MKVFSISNRNSGNRKITLVGNITTIMEIRATGKEGLTLFEVVIIQKSVKKTFSQ